MAIMRVGPPVPDGQLPRVAACLANGGSHERCGRSADRPSRCMAALALFQCQLLTVMVGQISRLAHLLSTPDHQLVSSDDREEVVDGCTRALRPHRLSLKSRKSRLATRLHHLPLGNISINRLCYGTDVRVEPLTITEDEFLFSLPLTGSASLHYGRQTADVSAGLAALIGPYERFCFDIGATFDQIVVRLDRTYVETVCANLIGNDCPLPVNFELAIKPPIEDWVPLLESAASIAQIQDEAGRRRLFAPVEELIVGSLLLKQPHTRTVDIASISRAPLPAQIRRAVTYMRENFAVPIKVQEVASYCGMSVRSLQLGFQREFGCSPTAWLRSERLNQGSCSPIPSRTW